MILNRKEKKDIVCVHFFSSKGKIQMYVEEHSERFAYFLETNLNMQVETKKC